MGSQSQHLSISELQAHGVINAGLGAPGPCVPRGAFQNLPLMAPQCPHLQYPPGRITIPASEDWSGTRWAIIHLQCLADREH